MKKAKPKKSKPRAHKLKTFRVCFNIEMESYRDVQAFDEDDAMEQVDGDWVDMADVERAEPCTIRVIGPGWISEVIPKDVDPK